VDAELQSIGISLTEAAVRNTAATVADRIGAAKARKRDQETVALLEEIVNDLISDKSELTRIAQAYEQELVAQRLSAHDVEYITSNIVPVLENLAASAAGDRDSADTVHEVMDVLKPILSVETVTVLQLIGFNFRKAIGEPLTDLVSRLILARAQSDATANAEIQRLAIQRELALMQIAADPEAHERFLTMIGQR
jgi:hypothetical protein